MLPWSLPRGMIRSTSRTRNGNSLRHPLHRPSCWPNGTCLFWRYGTGALMSVCLGMSVRAVTSRLWSRSPMDCCRRILTSSTALSEMLTPIHRRLKLSAATHAVAQLQTRKASQKGQAQKTFYHFSQMKTPSRESRCRQALNLPWPTSVRGGRSGSAWPGSLRFGWCGYSEHRMLLVARLPLHCTDARQLRILPLLTRGIGS